MLEMSPKFSMSTTHPGHRNVSAWLPQDLYDRLKIRLPKYGDRSKAIIRLLEKFLANEVKLEVPSRKL